MSRVPVLFRCRLLLCSVCLAATSLTGCASSDIPPTEVPDNPELVSIAKNWGTYVGFGPSYRDYRWQPAQDDQWIYVTSKQGQIYRLGKKNGRREVFASFTKEITGGLALERELLLFGNIEGELIALHTGTREIEWRVALGSEVLHPPATDGRLVGVKTNNGQLWGVELLSGTIRWTAITNNPPLTTRAKSAPVFAAGIVLSSFDTGKLAIINPNNGARLWEATIGESTSRNEIQRIIDSDSSPVFDPPYVYAANLNGSLRAFRLASGQLPQPIWDTDFSTHHNFALDESSIYAVDDQSRIHAFNKENGEKIWSNTRLQYHGLGEPLLWQGYLISANAHGYVSVFQPENGKLLGIYRVSPYAISSSLIADNDQLYLLDNGGYLSSLAITADNDTAHE